MRFGQNSRPGSICGLQSLAGKTALDLGELLIKAALATATPNAITSLENPRRSLHRQRRGKRQLKNPFHQTPHLAAWR
jgi:hypothetical protein